MGLPLQRTAVLVAATLAAALTLAPAASRASGETRSNAWSEIKTPNAGVPRIIGGVAHGCVIGASELPPDGPGYAAIRLSRHRNFGHPSLVRYIETLGRTSAAAGLPPFYVGDMAQPRGGPLPFGHASHQTGLDVDIWFALQAKPALPPEAREAVDLPSMLLANYREIDPRRFGVRQIELLRLAASAPEVERIFVNPVIKAALCRRAKDGDRAWLGRIRPWFGHDEHFHVRLKCPADSPECEAQKPVPDGDGCGAELASWLHHLPPPPTEHGPPRHPSLPFACHAVLTQR
jgi:penicillin-insensitive murein DD-endopeptidase